MKPSLHHLIEDHFKPKWWQLFRKQKYHVCNKGLDWQIFEVSPKRCIMSHSHYSGPLASVGVDKVAPRCHDGCSPIIASDPDFFSRLDQYLGRRCFECESRDEKVAAYAVTATQIQSSGKWSL